MKTSVNHTNIPVQASRLPFYLTGTDSLTIDEINDFTGCAVALDTSEKLSVKIAEEDDVVIGTIFAQPEVTGKVPNREVVVTITQQGGLPFPCATNATIGIGDYLIGADTNDGLVKGGGTAGFQVTDNSTISQGFVTAIKF